ncbi:hypothetical protein M8J77_022487 [Diaphorina citri]|nr:hypothetical protein M8J77_022487 [Diaphorina citri]
MSDVLKDDLKSLKINLNTWRYQAGDRNTWRPRYTKEVDKSTLKSKTRQHKEEPKDMKLKKTTPGTAHSAISLDLEEEEDNIHYRSKHPGIENPFLQSIRPVREVHSRQSTDSISSHSTLSHEFTISTISDVVCILCNRAFKSRAGLTSHRRGNTCGVMRGGGTSDR